MFKKLFSSLTASGRAKAEMQVDPTPIAVAALLVEAARADESYTDKEKSIIERALAEQFSLPADKAADLRARAEKAQSDASDIHRFTKIAKELTLEEKTGLVETLWSITLSDGARDKFEDSLIRRICGLIYFSDIDSGKARQRASAKLGA